MLPTLVNSETIRVRVPRQLDEGQSQTLKKGIKRKRLVEDQTSEEDTNAVAAGIIDNLKVADESVRRKHCMRLKHIRVSELVLPKSSYYGWQPPMPPSSEEYVLQELLVSYTKFMILSYTNID